VKLSLATAITAFAILAATIVCYFTIGRVIWWACDRLLETAMPLERERNLTLLFATNTAIGLVAGLACAYVAVQFVYSMKSTYFTREPIVPYLASALAVIAAFSELDQGPHSVPAWEVLRIDLGLFLVHHPVPLVVGLIAGMFIGHRIHSARTRAS
jgi:hypothetical protein